MSNGSDSGVFGTAVFLSQRRTTAMISTGEHAPTFTATLGTSEHETFALADHLGDGSVVLAFFPGAFTPPCTNEMLAFQDRLEEFEEAGATIFGISADSPFSLGAFREEYDLEFSLVSDTAGEVIADFGIGTELPDLGLYGIANRAVFVLNDEGVVTHRWIAEDPTNEPDYQTLPEAVEAS